MDTLQEALFRAMLNNDWFTDSDGDVESPTGYFGYVVNEFSDWPEVVDAFEETINSYADGSFWHMPNLRNEWIRANFCGVYSAHIDSNGIIHIYKHGDYVRTPGVAVMGIEVTRPVQHAMQTFKNRVSEFSEWDIDSDDHQGGN